MELQLNKYQQEEIAGLSTEYPYVYHNADLMTTRIPWHWHEELEFDYVTSGTLTLTTLNRSYEFQAREAFFINTNILCTMSPAAADRPLLLDSHLFNAVLLGGHYKSIYTTKYLTPILHNKNIDIIEIRGRSPRQREMLTKLKQLTRLQKIPDTEMQTRNLLAELWLLLLAESRDLEYQQPLPHNADQERLQSMMAYIHRHYDQKVTVPAIAAAAAISERECLRCFRHGINKSPSEYLLEYRTDKAVQLLQSSELPILDIAIQTGFNNNAYFGKVFKKLKGMTPGEYRRAYKK